MKPRLLSFFLIPFLAISAQSAEFDEKIRPILEEFCFDCHAGGMDKGGLDFDAYPNHAALLADHGLWEKATRLLASHVMPPPEKATPSPGQRDTLLDWIDHTVFYVDPENPDPGPVVVRRLNRAEYNNTIRDLFQTDLRPAEVFPPDDSAHGFDHIGNTLSPMLLEKHLRAVREVITEATQLMTIQQAGELVRGNKFTAYAGEPEIQEQLVVFRKKADQAGFDVRLPIDGLYRIKIRAASTRPEEKFATLEVLDNGEPITEFTPEHVFKGKRQYWDANFALIQLREGRHRFALRLKDPDEDQVAGVHTFAIQGPYAPVPPKPSRFLTELLGEQRRLGTPSLRLSGEDFERGEGKSSLDTGKSWFATRGYRFTDIALTEPGRYRFRIKAGAQQAGLEFVQLGVRFGERTLAEPEVTSPAQQAQWIEFETEAAAGQHELQVWFLNELMDENGNPRRLLWLHEMEIQGPLDSTSTLSYDELPGLLTKSGRRIFRRPLTVAESEKLASLAISSSEPPLETLRIGLESLLSSPKFLFLGSGIKPEGEPSQGSVPIDEFSLATRLSYFLWSSCPDEELLNLAASRQLRQNLEKQVTRMLDDEKSTALTENFAGQWLQLRDLDHLTRDPEKFPTFDAALAAEMRQETEQFFSRILHQNLAATQFLEAPGLLTQRSILTLTSHPTRTSPVNRGKFILEKLLGTPPPPAPARVPPLEETTVDPGASLRDQLEAHRSNKQCAACHAFLDPMGLALENFDAIGRWRDTDKGKPIDASGQLVTGERFGSFEDLQNLLATEKQDLFLKNLVEQLLTYALARGLTFEDKIAVREILEKAARDDYRLQTIILAITESVPFQKMRSN